MNASRPAEAIVPFIKLPNPQRATELASWCHTETPSTWLTLFDPPWRSPETTPPNLQARSSAYNFSTKLILVTLKLPFLMYFIIFKKKGKRREGRLEEKKSLRKGRKKETVGGRKTERKKERRERTEKK